MLSWSPNTRFNSFPLNQLTAYVFWATAKDSPPILNVGEEKSQLWKKPQLAISTLLPPKSRTSVPSWMVVGLRLQPRRHSEWMLHGHKHPKDGIGHFGPALTAGVLSYFAQMVTIPMLHKSNLHERHHLKTNGSLRNLSIQYAKQQAPGDSSLWPSMNLCSRDPRHQDRQPTHILHLPQTVNKYDDCLLLWCVGMMRQAEFAIMTCNKRSLTSAPSVLHKTLRGQTVMRTHFIKMKSHFSDQYAKHL